MRILHTSDWHLGQLFYQYDRTEEHQRFLDWLLETIATEHADALLIAGDVFDHANPSAASQKQLYRFLTDARHHHPHLAIVIIAGNHDSPGRLEAPSPFFDALDITVMGQVPRDDEGAIDAARLCVPLRDGAGAVAAWCLAVPFLRTGDFPAAGPAAAPGNAPATMAGAYAAGIARVYGSALDAALTRRTSGQALVAMGHCSVGGGVASEDSERAILAGGLDTLTPESFDSRLAYVALGHLHLPQQTGPGGRLRYSGSPLPLSFAEIDYPHQIVCIDLDGETASDVRTIPVPRFAPLLRIPDVPSPPDDVLAAIARLEVPDTPEPLRPYVEVRVLLEKPEPGLRSRIEEALSATPVRLAKIEVTYTRTSHQAEPVPGRSLDDLATLRPDNVFQQVYRDRFGADAPPEYLAAFGELLRSSGTEGL